MNDKMIPFEFSFPSNLLQLSWTWVRRRGFCFCTHTRRVYLQSQSYSVWNGEVYPDLTGDNSACPTGRLKWQNRTIYYTCLLVITVIQRMEWWGLPRSSRWLFCMSHWPSEITESYSILHVLEITVIQRMEWWGLPRSNRW